VIVHYVRRFFTSLSRRPPHAADEQWVERLVTPAELLLFRRLSNTDRRHLIHSARMVEGALGPDADPVWVRVALLHDVGKFDSHLGVFGRVSATVLATALGTERVRTWASTSSWKGRIGSYQRHGEIGAAEIRAAGGPEDAAVWSELHHHPDQFAAAPIPPEILTILDAADH
jgi:hypothetical protein